MYNKTASFVVAFLVMVLSVFLTAFLPEKNFFHVFYHMVLISIIILSLFLTVKDLVVVLMVFSSIIWGMGLMGLVKEVGQLLAESAIVIGVAFALGWYEVKFKVEKSKTGTIVNYKKKEVEDLGKRIAEINSQNNAVLEEIRKFRKEFRD